MAWRGVNLTSCSVSFRMNLAGLPPQSSPEGIRLAGGTTDPGVNILPDSTMAPSQMTERAPIRTWDSTRHALKTLYGSIVTWSAISVAGLRPVGTDLHRGSDRPSEDAA